MCLWKGLEVQATGMSGRRPQFTASVQLPSYATGIMSSAFHINQSVDCQQVLAILKENTHSYELVF